MKISGVDIRPGNIIEYEGGIWKVAKIQHTQPGKGGAYMQVEMKNLQDGRKTNVRFRSADTVEKVRLDTQEFQFLYEDGDMLVFMDTNTYEQINLPNDLLGDARPFLQDGMQVMLELWEEKPISVQLPAQIEAAIFDLLSQEKIVAEGAPGAGLAVIEQLSDQLQGKKVGLVVCGGNIDSRLLSTLILRGLVRDGRITRLTFEINDTPGQLAKISRIIGEAGANVVEVIHQRMMQSVSLKQAELEIVIEARDKSHVADVLSELRGAGFQVRADSEIA